MRTSTFTVCLIALAACADSKTPTAPTARLAASGDRPGEPRAPRQRIDPRPISEQLDALLRPAFSRVTLPADGFSLSSEAVHPDIACPTAAWNGVRCWLLYTPYKNSDPSWENPSFLVAENDTSWITPPSIKNPLIPYPGIGGYNSDPDQAFDPGNNRLTQVYRVVADTFNKIMITSTANGKTWVTPRLAFKERNHDAVSPALVIDGDRSANLWYVRAGAAGCSSTTTNVALRTATPDSNERLDQADWSAAKAVNLSIPNSVIWHLDVTALPGGPGYIALVVAYPRGATCGSSDLWLATSEDGIEWKSFAIPALWRSAGVARARSVSTWYRGTLLYDPSKDLLHIWPSGLADGAWTIYHTAVKLSDLFDLLNLARPSDLKLLATSQANIHATIQMP